MSKPYFGISLTSQARLSSHRGILGGVSLRSFPTLGLNPRLRVPPHMAAYGGLGRSDAVCLEKRRAVLCGYMLLCGFLTRKVALWPSNFRGINLDIQHPDAQNRIVPV